MKKKNLLKRIELLEQRLSAIEPENIYIPLDYETQQTGCIFDNLPESERNKSQHLACFCPKHSVSCFVPFVWTRTGSTTISATIIANN